MDRAHSIAMVILGLCVSPLFAADEPVSTVPATLPQIQQTVDRAIGYLQTESATWMKFRKCASCHHAAMPMWALSDADQLGYATDKTYLTDLTEATLGSLDKMIASKLFYGPNDPPDPRPMGKGIKIGTVFMAVAARSLPSLTDGQRQSLKIIEDEIIEKQREDGSWEFFLPRPPMNENQTTDAAWTIMALQGDASAELPAPNRIALKKAVDWLASTQLPDTHQDKFFKLLLAIRAHKARQELQPLIDELLGLQQPDGGWRQNADMTSDAFATGQSLYALALAGHMSERPEIRRAIDFLVATQKPDGTWPMVSRSTPDGSPGSSTLMTPINCGACAWAILGLSHLAPKGP